MSIPPWLGYPALAHPVDSEVIEDLVNETLSILREYKGTDRSIIVKIACGINEFTKFEHHKEGKDLRLKSDVSSRTVFNRLKSLKEKIKTELPTAVVGFITIHTLSFINYRDFLRLNPMSYKRSGRRSASDKELQADQAKLDKELTLLYADKKLENSRKQSGLLKGCYTISWHNSISKVSIRKRKSGSRKVIRNNFADLHDGLHPKNSLKRRWHKQLVKCATSELDLIRQNNLKTTKVTLAMANAEPAGTKKPVIMPDPFRGEIEEDWKDWLDNFKACAEINGWNDDLKCKFMGVRLKDTAYKVYQDTEAAVKTDWTNLCATLEKRFRTVKEPMFYKTKFNATKQLQGDTLLDLGNKIRKLARKAYPTIEAGLRDELARDQFGRALTNVDMTLKLRHCMPATLDDGIRMAIDWQTVELDFRKDKSTTCFEPPKADSLSAGECSATTQETALMTMMNEVLRMTKEDRERARRSRGQNIAGKGRGRGRNENDYKCFICGSEQHLKRNCPKNRECWNCGFPGHMRNDYPSFKQCKQTVLIAKDLAHQCLLGTDFMKKHNAKIDFDKMTISVDNNECNVNYSTRSAAVCRVNLKQTVCIPSGNEMLLIGKVKKKERGFQKTGTFLFEPKQRFENHDKVCAAYVLTEGKDLCSIRVMNVSAEDVTMYKNTTVGYLLPVKEHKCKPSLEQQIAASGGLKISNCSMLEQQFEFDRKSPNEMIDKTQEQQFAAPGTSFNIDSNVQSGEREGSNHNNADCMSRRPTAQLETEDRDDGITSDSEFCQAVCVGDQIDWKKAQLKDVDLNLIQDLKSASNDKAIVEERYSSTVKRLIGQWENIVPRDGILYRKFEDTNGTAYQFLVPTELKRNILETLHSGIGGGHLGTKKMLRKLKDRFYWPGWSQDVEIFCEECLTCATRRNPAKHLRAPLVSVKTGAPLEKIAMDILGPLPTSSRGNKYILVISDYFSKWTKAFALRNHKAKTIAKKLVEEFICRFGAPYAVHSDQGRDFESNLITEISILFESKKRRTTAYHPQCDGQVERFNETLLNMLSKHVKEDQKNWDEQIPFLMMAYRCSVNETTGFSPSMLMLGHDLRLPIDVVFGECPQEESNKTQYVTSLRQNLNLAFEKVRTNINYFQKRQKDYYDKKISGKQISVGDLVMSYNPAVKPGRTHKLQQCFNRI
ncbi:unnamed protein product [Mytilus coruscus]|uniref:Retrovirus-related Pol polyprotein from transposon 412 n=1 Tax=Mytilus coruscus TaxID=42192 RepID=A0A6J8CAU4_MYTCO|nr:unnamed protein product [Mytilus coruscus]